LGACVRRNGGVAGFEAWSAPPVPDRREGVARLEGRDRGRRGGRVTTRRRWRVQGRRACRSRAAHLARRCARSDRV